MLFVEADIPNYFPNIELTGTDFENFVNQVQSIIESPLGANRPLELQRHQEILRLNRTHQTTYLSNKPVNLTNPPILQARIGNAVAAVSGNIIPQHDWMTIDVNQYQIDELTGKLSLFTNRGGNLTYAYGGANLGEANLFTEVKIEYDAGFDFNSTSDLMVKRIKSNAALIAKYIYGDPVGYAERNRGSSAFNGKQIRSEDIKDEYKVEYFNSSSSSDDGLYGTSQGQIPRSLLQFFTINFAVLL